MHSGLSKSYRQKMEWWLPAAERWRNGELKCNECGVSAAIDEQFLKMDGADGNTALFLRTQCD